MKTHEKKNGPEKTRVPNISPADKLQAEIDKGRQTIHSSQYSISIGELASMYRDKELWITPEFQRLFRWSDEQKSKFIESLLLGIPTPSIFVSQRDDGVWDVVDGLQRLSTIFQFMGELLDADGKKRPPLQLTETTYLPSLDGMYWKSTPGSPAFSLTQQLLVKRSKLDVQIVLRESDDQAKFELFQRLNTGGSVLTEQEIRNAILVAAHPEFLNWLKTRAKSKSFVECTGLSDRQDEEQYNLELVLRFLVLRTLPVDRFSEIGDLGKFLTIEMKRLATSLPDWSAREAAAFDRTFSVLSETLVGDAFRRWNSEKGRFLGAFSISAFEVVAMGIGSRDARAAPIKKVTLEEIVKSIWSNPGFINTSGSGIRASTRIPKTLALGRELFAK